MSKMIRLLLMLALLMGSASAGSPANGDLLFQIVRTEGERVLWQASARPGDHFTIEYRHSSDHTPVRDLFRIGDDGEIVLIEESYQWYGAGLESHPDVGKTDFSGNWTRVRVQRVFPRFLLRIGEITDQVLTIHDQKVPLLSIAKGRESVWIRTTTIVGKR